MVDVDGSFGSGGGAIVRTACALSAVTKKPCRVFNIRRGREKPGLMNQHLLGIRALAQLCNGRLEGDELGSEEIKFYPGPIGMPSASYGVKEIKVKIETASSVTLCLQTLVPVALFAPSPIKIIFDGGATDTFFSPTIDHFRYVFLKILEKMGARVEIEILRRGYYPEGGAKVEAKVFPSKLKPLNLVERGLLKKILIVSGASNVLRAKKVAERQVAGVREILGRLKLPMEEKVEYYDACCPGSQICLIAEFANTVIGTDNLGKLGKRAEDIGKETALELLSEQKSEACLDKHLADQILLYLALSAGKSQATVSEITNHCKTNIWVVEKFTQCRDEVSGAGFMEGRFEIKDNLIIWRPRKI